VAARSQAAELPEGLLEALEQVMYAAIGLTTIALEQAAPGDLTLQQWRALVVLGRSGDTRVSDVAARVGISLPSASRLITRLMERGYVDSARDDRDRRETRVTLTRRGAEVRRAVISRRRQLLLASMGADAGTLPSGLGRDLAKLARAFEDYA
jgi:DNA-binding MarR family transcriptional regulator